MVWLEESPFLKTFSGGHLNNDKVFRHLARQETREITFMKKYFILKIFYFWPHPEHAETPGPGMEPEPQQ